MRLSGQVAPFPTEVCLLQSRLFSLKVLQAILGGRLLISGNSPLGLLLQG